MLCVGQRGHAVAPCGQLAVYRGLSGCVQWLSLLWVQCELLSRALVRLAFMRDIVWCLGATIVARSPTPRSISRYRVIDMNPSDGRKWTHLCWVWVCYLGTEWHTLLPDAMWLCMCVVYHMTGCRAFSIFSPEVFEQAMNVLKILNTSGNACGFVIAFHVCDGWLTVAVYNLYNTRDHKHVYKSVCFCIIIVC